ncbi:amino acid permease [Kitasatospora sp. NPDC049285]|uniref:APC family permease n=1 Tax=Kitasatospora sp. NPDC049285 TaxID=3157096 RepID=UPI00341D712E
MTETSRPKTDTSGSYLSTTGASALYIGALLGPSLLLLPGLAARLAGPASLLLWLALLVLSGLIAAVFCGLGTRLGSTGGVARYTAAGLGERAGAAAAWCFLAGVVLGAPVVCLIGGRYAAAMLGAGDGVAIWAALGLLAVVLAVRLAGVRTGVKLQLVLVAVLAALVVLAVLGAAPHARAANWHPCAPHGWSGIAQAAPPLMFAFVGWEAAAPLTTRLRDPRRQLRRVVLAAFAVTSLVYLGLAAATVGVLGAGAGGPVPLADLLRVAIGAAGPTLAVVLALALTLAATNAYLTGAAAMAEALLPRKARGAVPGGGDAAGGGRRGTVGIVAVTALTGGPMILLVGNGVLGTDQLVSVPTALFLAVYLGCTAAAARVLPGALRLAAAISAVTVLVLLAGTGWPALAAAAVALLAAARTPAARPVPADATTDVATDAAATARSDRQPA